MSLHVSAQKYAWELVPTQETSHLVAELVTDQGYLVASGKGTFVSKDQGASWEAFPDARGFKYSAIGDQIILADWGTIAVLDLAQGTVDTIATQGSIIINSTENDQIGYLRQDIYTVIDLEGNLVSENPIANPSSFTIRDFFVETGFPSFTLGLDYAGYFVNEVSSDFEVSSEKRHIPVSVNLSLIHI